MPVRNRIYVGFIDPLAGIDLIFGTRYSATCYKNKQKEGKELETVFIIENGCGM